MKSNKITVVALVFATIIVGLIIGSCSKKEEINYGVSPYQDTILPVVAEKMGWYTEEGLDVKLKVLAWGEVMNSLAAGAVDVAIQNFNSFQATYHNINDRGGDVIFYYPFFIFKGASLTIRSDGTIKTLDDMLKQYPDDREGAIKATVEQLEGKTVITTQGTEMEQIALAAIEKAGLELGKDVKIVHAQPDEGLNAFLRGEGDVYSGGVTEKTEAARHGALTMIESSDLNPPVIDGLVTTAKFAKDHPDVLSKLIKLWFRTIQFMEKDLDENSKLVIDYLSAVSSTRYDVEEYKYTWFNTEVYPENAKEMAEILLSEQSPYFWKISWDANNNFLSQQKKIPKPVPYEAFWMTDAHKLYLDKYGN